ncbi:recombination protein RecR [Mycoplasma sp. NEAQ87857]|uniref:toprim domain-containing protein n=1 Tax=Mycoplasma sp. NEAQ87857 TaxID=2683967 RepID=UPI0013161FFA|nr:toprim domain-containing protein [Mycoplasma sp. NEAQ87857]QGZ97896.1 recombination protein RecR [Mycoplasma sp. NEAQ87857]
MLDTFSINDFIDRIKKIPGISKKQAEKMVYWILNTEQQEVFLLSNAFKKVKENVTFCLVCGNAVELSNCNICNDESRLNTLLIVENVAIIDKIEKANIYKGKYYVFKHYLSDASSLTKYQNEIDKLINHAKQFSEIILGISPDLKGEMTNILLKNKLEAVGLKTSQLAIGIPLGASLDYIDPLTLKFSLSNRQK